MLFKKSKKPGGMDLKQLRSLDKRPLKYVTERDGETFREIKIGGEGAINISDTELTVVCGGINAIRCLLTNVSAAELMNLSGIVIKGNDLDSGTQRNIIAYYSDGYVSAARAKQR